MMGGKASRELYHLSIEIGGVPLCNAAEDKTWRARKRMRDDWCNRVHYSTVGKRPPAPLEFSIVSITRCSSMMPDYDNLQHGVKFLLDALQRSGIIIDDAPHNIGVPLAYWRRAKRGKARTLIEVTECSMDELDLSAWLTD